MLNKTVLIDVRRARTLGDFYYAMAKAFDWDVQERRAPSNLDGLADLAREGKFSTLVLTHCMLDDAILEKIRPVFDDLGVKIILR